MIPGNRAWLLLALALPVCLAAVGPAGRALGDDSATTTPTAQAIPTATITPTPTATPLPPPTPVVEFPTATSVVPHPERTPATPRPPIHLKKPAPTPTPTRVRENARPSNHGKHGKRGKKPGHPKPTPTPTATPILNLTADDSISPVTCNGPGTQPAAKPFLVPPYHGWVSINSFFDHDSPNFLRDGLVVTASGMQAGPDGVHERGDFPAYWDAQTRQFVFYDGHNGYDFNAWYQPVYAAAAGKVIFARYEYPQLPASGYGKMVMIEHRGGYVTLYGHLSRILVKSGQKVHRGQKIAISGNTGHSTGPHLHFTVFHNCTPVDPYGWSGSGPDPLQSYKGESSVYLWLQPPLVDNPPHAWPGIGELPPNGTDSIVLLKLPATNGGVTTFTDALRTEAGRVAAALGLQPADWHADMLLGDLDITVPVSAAQVYNVAGVASLASLDTLAGQRDDVLAALARALLATSRPQLRLGHSPKWSASVLSWEGRTLLIGKGEKGATLTVRLSIGRGGATTHHVRADNRSGAYVIDLGHLSAGETRQLTRNLSSASTTTRPPSKPAVRRVPAAPHHQTSFTSWGLLAALLLCLCAALAAAFWQRRYLAGLLRSRST